MILVRTLSERVLARVLCVRQILILVISLGSFHSYLGTKYMWNFICTHFHNGNQGPIKYSSEIIRLCGYYNQRANISLLFY